VAGTGRLKERKFYINYNY